MYYNTNIQTTLDILNYLKNFDNEKIIKFMTSSNWKFDLIITCNEIIVYFENLNEYIINEFKDLTIFTYTELKNKILKFIINICTSFSNVANTNATTQDIDKDLVILYDNKISKLPDDTTDITIEMLVYYYLYYIEDINIIIHNYYINIEAIQEYINIVNKHFNDINDYLNRNNITDTDINNDITTYNNIYILLCKIIHNLSIIDHKLELFQWINDKPDGTYDDTIIGNYAYNVLKLCTIYY